MLKSLSRLLICTSLIVGSPSWADTVEAQSFCLSDHTAGPLIHLQNPTLEAGGDWTMRLVDMDLGIFPMAVLADGSGLIQAVIGPERNHSPSSSGWRYMDIHKRHRYEMMTFPISEETAQKVEAGDALFLRLRWKEDSYHQAPIGVQERKVSNMDLIANLQEEPSRDRYFLSKKPGIVRNEQGVFLVIHTGAMVFHPPEGPISDDTSLGYQIIRAEAVDIVDTSGNVVSSFDHLERISRTFPQRSESEVIFRYSYDCDPVRRARK